jgi:hypothetical protein
LPVGDECAEAGEITGSAGVGSELVEAVQRVDPRPLRPVEPAGAEGYGLVLALGRDVDELATAATAATAAEFVPSFSEQET